MKKTLANSVIFALPYSYSSGRSRLSAENAEYLKEIHELKVSLDNVNHLKSQLATQLEDTRRRLEDEERVCFIFYVN